VYNTVESFINPEIEVVFVVDLYPKHGVFVPQIYGGKVVVVEYVIGFSL
jgi:hypothetical protein